MKLRGSRAWDITFRAAYALIRVIDPLLRMGPERDAVHIATADQQPFPVNLLYRERAATSWARAAASASRAR